MSHKTQKAFTMVELIFVIVIIGILSAVAVPKFSKTSTIAYAARAESVVATLRSAIASQRQKNILRGNAATVIDTAAAAALLTYGLDSTWALTDSDTFTYTVPGGSATCAFDIEGGKLVKKTCHADTGLSHL